MRIARIENKSNLDGLLADAISQGADVRRTRDFAIAKYAGDTIFMAYQIDSLTWEVDYNSEYYPHVLQRG